MLKQCILICLLAALAVQTLNGLAIVVNYYSNTATYAAKCENKAKPMLHCNGRCQMLKKIKQEENKEKQNPGRSNRKYEVLSARSFFGQIDPLIATSQFIYPVLPCEALTDMPADFFHPPGLEIFSLSTC